MNKYTLQWTSLNKDYIYLVSIDAKYIDVEIIGVV